MTAHDEAVLDDPEALRRADPGEVLLDLAGAGARVRRAALACAESGLRPLTAADRPRIVALAALPECGPLAAAVHALAGPGIAVPVIEVGDASLPGWAGPLDLLVLVALRGDEPELLDLAEQGYRRGCQLVALAPAGSALHSAAAQVRGTALSVTRAGDSVRGAYWPLLVATLVTAAAHGVGGPGLHDLDRTIHAADALADRLDTIALRCRPQAATYDNPAKSHALELADTVPVVWGTGTVAGVAARYVAAALGRTAGTPALHGTLPGAARTAGRLFDGQLSGGDHDDFFRDRVDDAELRLRLLLLTDAADPATVRRADVVRAIARDRGVQVDEASSDAPTALERLGELAALGDFTATYLALAGGADPAAPGPFATYAALTATGADVNGGVTR